VNDSNIISDFPNREHDYHDYNHFITKSSLFLLLFLLLFVLSSSLSSSSFLLLPFFFLLFECFCLIGSIRYCMHLVFTENPPLSCCWAWTTLEKPLSCKKKKKEEEEEGRRRRKKDEEGALQNEGLCVEQWLAHWTCHLKDNYERTYWKFFESSFERQFEVLY